MKRKRKMKIREDDQEIVDFKFDTQKWAVAIYGSLSS